MFTWIFTICCCCFFFLSFFFCHFVFHLVSFHCIWKIFINISFSEHLLAKHSFRFVCLKSLHCLIFVIICSNLTGFFPLFFPLSFHHFWITEFDVSVVIFFFFSSVLYFLCLFSLLPVFSNLIIMCVWFSLCSFGVYGSWICGFIIFT